MRSLLLIAALLINLPIDLAGQSGGVYAVTESVVAGGSGSAVGGVLALERTVGQPLAMRAAGSGTVLVTSGFWNNTSVGPTAANASIRGRILTANGNGIVNVIVNLSDSSGKISQFIRTSAFGYYQFEQVPVGSTYVVRVSSKRFQFVPDMQIITLNDELNELNFIAEP